MSETTCVQSKLGQQSKDARFIPEILFLIEAKPTLRSIPVAKMLCHCQGTMLSSSQRSDVPGCSNSCANSGFSALCAVSLCCVECIVEQYLTCQGMEAQLNAQLH